MENSSFNPNAFGPETVDELDGSGTVTTVNGKSFDVNSMEADQTFISSGPFGRIAAGSIQSRDGFVCSSGFYDDGKMEDADTGSRSEFGIAGNDSSSNAKDCVNILSEGDIESQKKVGVDDGKSDSNVVASVIAFTENDKDVISSHASENYKERGEGKSKTKENLNGYDEKNKCYDSSGAESNNTDLIDAENGNEKAVTQMDEFGRPLSAYEIMRLKRIRRNQAYLARLGLERESHDNGSSSTLLSPYAKKTQREKKLRKSLSELNAFTDVERRPSSRRTKTVVNYSELPGARLEPTTGASADDRPDVEYDEPDDPFYPKVSEPGICGKKPKNEPVPLFVFKELKHVESKRRQALKAAEKDLRAAEIEYRYAKRQADVDLRKIKRKKEAEEKRVTSEKMFEEHKVHLALYNEAEQRKTELANAQIVLENEMKATMMEIEAKEQEAKKSVTWAMERFPQAVDETMKSLDHLLVERCRVAFKGHWDLLDHKVSPETSSAKLVGRKRKQSSSVASGKRQKADLPDTVNRPVSSKHKSTATVWDSAKTLPSLIPASQFPELSKGFQSKPIVTPTDYSKTPKPRNVGGPVTRDFANSLQRQWLEGDVPLVTCSTVDFVPQVGDTVLYYPLAHFRFLQVHPDIRGVKRKLAMRKPLWEKAKDEQHTLNNEMGELAQNKRPSWWNDDWVSSVMGPAGCYPILCRVEHAHAEFPSDLSGRFNKVTKKEGLGIDKEEDVRDDHHDHQPSKGNGPPVGLTVTLRPLTNVMPPKLVLNLTNTSCAYEGDELSLPPAFSVLIFPCEVPSFLVPFAWAYRQSLSLMRGDSVTFKFDSGDQFFGLVVDSQIDRCLQGEAFELLSQILTDDIGADFWAGEKLNYLISSSYLDKKSNNPLMSMSEEDFRVAVQIVLDQLHQRTVAPDSTLEHSRIWTLAASISDSSNMECNASSNSHRLNNLVNWIRMTLPAWDSVHVRWDDSSEIRLNPWVLTKISPEDSLTDYKGLSASLLGTAAPVVSPTSKLSNLVYSVDNGLITKIGICIQDFIKENPSASIFVPPVTEKNAPGYYCVVPFGMSFQRILRRMKLFCTNDSLLKRSVLNDLTHEQEAASLVCCYYRSVGSLLSDLSLIYQNCLLYNDPDSIIVSTSRGIVDRLKKDIEKLEMLYRREVESQNRKKQIQSFNPELPKWEEGRDTLTTYPLSRSASFSSEINEAFDTPIFRDWLQDCAPDESWDWGKSSTSAINGHVSKHSYHKPYWVPQYGDKIVYNQFLHAAFVKGHFSGLTAKQRALLSVVPLQKNLKIPVKETRNDDTIESCILESWLLGSVTFVRAVFPPKLKPFSQGKKCNFNELSPVLQIGIQFHCSWLGKKHHTVYWRPCRLICGTRDLRQDYCDDTDQSLLPRYISSDRTYVRPMTLDMCNCESVCELCGLSTISSFIQPAWSDLPFKVIPPNQKAMLEPPLGLPPVVAKSIANCIEVLRHRCLAGISISAVDMKSCTRLLCSFSSTSYKSPPELEHFFSDDDSDDEPGGHSTSVLTGTNTENTILSHVNFLPSCSSIPPSHDILAQIQTQDCGLSGKMTNSTAPLHTMCLDLIQRRICNGYYRQRLAAVHDVRETYVSCMIYLLRNACGDLGTTASCANRITKALLNAGKLEIKDKDQLQQKRIVGTKSSRKKASRDADSRSLSLYVSAVDSPNLLSLNKTSTKSHSNNRCSDELSSKETAILRRIEIIRELYATALVIINETPTAETALGQQDPFSTLEHFSANQYTEDRLKALRIVDALLKSLRRDPCAFRNPLAASEPYPTVRVTVTFKDDQRIDFAEKRAQIETSPTVVSHLAGDNDKKTVVSRNFFRTEPDVDNASGGVFDLNSKKTPFHDAGDVTSNVSTTLDVSPESDTITSSKVEKDFANVRQFVSVSSAKTDASPVNNKSAEQSPSGCGNRAVFAATFQPNHHDFLLSKVTSHIKSVVVEGPCTASDRNTTTTSDTGSNNKSHNEVCMVSLPTDVGSVVDNVAGSKRLHSVNTCSADIISDAEEETFFGESTMRPILLSLTNYEMNSNLVRALFCCGGRKHVCAKCKVHKSNLLRCRVRKAHSHPDFTWLDSLNEIGGIDALIKMLNPALTLSSPVRSRSPAPPISAPQHMGMSHNDNLQYFAPIQRMSSLSNQNTLPPSCDAFEGVDGIHCQTKTSFECFDSSDIQPVSDLTMFQAFDQPFCFTDPSATSLAGTHASTNEEGTNCMANSCVPSIDTRMSEDPVATKKGIVTLTNKVAREAEGEKFNDQECLATTTLQPEENNSSCLQQPGFCSNSRSAAVDTVIKRDIGDIIVSESAAKEQRMKDDIADETCGVNELDSLTILRRAELALQLAQNSLELATREMDSRLTLSHDFVQEYFPLDHSDGHYELCIVCGLGGDILCCETCPNVAHAECAGLTEIPVGDWHCDKCASEITGETHPNSQHTTLNGDIALSDTSLTKCENSVIDRAIGLRRNDCDAENNRATAESSQTKLVLERTLCKDNNTCDTAVEQTNSLLSNSLSELLSELKFIRTKNKPSVDQKSKLQKESDAVYLYDDQSKQEKKALVTEGADSGSNEDDENSSFTGSEGGCSTKTTKHKVGIKLLKTFSEGTFVGVVKAVPTNSDPYYKVLYNDGDEEEMSEGELEHHIELYAKKTGTKKIHRIAGKSLQNDASASSSCNTANSSNFKGKRSSNKTRKSRSPTQKKTDLSPKTDVVSNTPKRGRGRPRKDPTERTQSSVVGFISSFDISTEILDCLSNEKCSVRPGAGLNDSGPTPYIKKTANIKRCGESDESIDTTISIKRLSRPLAKKSILTKSASKQYDSLESSMSTGTTKRTRKRHTTVLDPLF